MSGKKVPANLPVYTFDGLLRLAGLATVTMLRQHRRQPAEGQQPVGQYWSGYDHVALYRAADAVDMPPLSPGRRRRYDEARTCAECGAKSLDPQPKGRDGKRYCEACQKPVHVRIWDAERAADRLVVGEWARGVLADPATVLVVSDYGKYGRRVYGIDVSGGVVIDAEVRFNERQPDPDHPAAAEIAAMLLPSELATTLAARRLVAWWPNLGPITVDGLPMGGADDFLGRWCDRWIGQADRGFYGSFGLEPRLASQPPPRGDAVAVVRSMRDLLGNMANGALGEDGESQ